MDTPSRSKRQERTERRANGSSSVPNSPRQNHQNEAQRAKRPTKAGPQKAADVRANGGSPGHGAKSEIIRERAVLALLSEATVGAAARRCGVNEKTLRRWVAEDHAFQRELATARKAMYEAGMARVQALAGEAVSTLVTLMGRASPPAVRLGAARTVTELAMHLYQSEVVTARLDEIEKYQREQADARTGRREDHHARVA